MHCVLHGCIIFRMCTWCFTWVHYASECTLCFNVCIIFHMDTFHMGTRCSNGCIIFQVGTLCFAWVHYVSMHVFLSIMSHMIALYFTWAHCFIWVHYVSNGCNMYREYIMHHTYTLCNTGTCVKCLHCVWRAH